MKINIFDKKQSEEAPGTMNVMIATIQCGRWTDPTRTDRCED